MVDVTCLDRDAGGDSVLTARWTVFDRDRDPLVVRESRLSDPVATPECAATVVAMNRALADLSREIAEAIKTLPEPAPGG